MRGRNIVPGKGQFPLPVGIVHKNNPNYISLLNRVGCLKWFPIIFIWIHLIPSRVDYLPPVWTSTEFLFMIRLFALFCPVSRTCVVMFFWLFFCFWQKKFFLGRIHSILTFPVEFFEDWSSEGMSEWVNDMSKDGAAWKHKVMFSVESFSFLSRNLEPNLMFNWRNSKNHYALCHPISFLYTYFNGSVGRVPFKVNSPQISLKVDKVLRNNPMKILIVAVCCATFAILKKFKSEKRWIPIFILRVKGTKNIL